MKMRKIFVYLITVMLVLGLSISTHAALIDLGGGMIYSTDLDLTWLQDANYAQTSGNSSDGLMTWDEATTWAENLTYGGIGGWRLPTFDLAHPLSHEMGYLRDTECGGDMDNCPFINVIGDSLSDFYWSRTTCTTWDGDPGAYNFDFYCS